MWIYQWTSPMKFLSILILLFLFAGEETAFSSTPSAGFENSTYGKSTLYNYLLEPVISLDENWGSIATHCSVLGEDLKKAQTYKGLGSCLFDQAAVFSSEGRVEKNIIFHITLEDRFFDLLFQWEGLSLQDVLASYINEDPHKLSSRISFRLVNSELSLSDFLSDLVSSELWTAQTAQENLLVQQTASLLLKRKISAVHLAVTPHSEGLIKAKLSFAASTSEVFYELEVITNYYAGADKYFTASIDQYQGGLNEE